MPLRIVPCALAFALSLAACGNFSRHGTAAVTTVKPTSYGVGQKLPELAKLEAFRKGRKGLLRVLLVDERNGPVAGAYIRYKGRAAKGQAATNARGIAEILIPPGNYEVDVAPCGPSVITKDYRSALATVVAGGQPSQGALTGIRWERRFHPVPTVAYSDDPPWKLNGIVRASIRVEDRCSFGAAPRAPLSTWGWKLSSNFAFAKKPVMRSDAKGFLNVSFTCTKSGNGSFVIYDLAPQEDPIDLLASGAGPGDGRRFCEK